MSNIAVLNKSLPSHLQQYQQSVDESKGLITSGGAGDRISIRGKQFRFIKDGEEISKLKIGMPVEVVILKADPEQGLAKAYFAEAYQPDADQLPDCHSSNGVNPDASSEIKQSPNCATCKWNAFGTGTDANGNAGKGKACADFKNLFVVLDDELDGSIWTLRVPATSLKALSSYGRELIEHNVPMYAIKTEIRFNEETDHPQLEFNALDFLDADDTKACFERSKSKELDLMLPSKNTPTSSAATESTQISPPPSRELPKPPSKTPKMTEKAEGIEYQDYIDSGWTDAQLIEYGYMEE